MSISNHLAQTLQNFFLTFGIILGFLVLVFVIFMAIIRYTMSRVPPVPPKSIDERFWEIIEPLRFKSDTTDEENKVDPKG